MATYQHPASLNVFQQYRQSCAILSGTSRARNRAWYQQAIELDHQWHIRVDGEKIETFLYDRNKKHGSTGPEFSEASITDGAQIESALNEAISRVTALGAKSLGVVLHVASEFAIAEIKPDLDNPASLTELKSAIANEPQTVLADASIRPDQGSWRLVPYTSLASGAIATSIHLSRQYEPLLQTMRRIGEAKNFPVICQALSAPLVALMGIPTILPLKKEKPSVVILEYPWLTVMAFLNESAELCMLRTIQHRGQRRANQLRNVVQTSCASLELIDPNLFLVPFTAKIEAKATQELQRDFPHSNVELVSFHSLDWLPAYAPEPGILSADAEQEKQFESDFFTSLRSDGWALQDFIPDRKELVEIFPNKEEMKLLRVAKAARLTLTACAMGALAFFGYGMFKIYTQEEWKFDPTASQIAKNRLKMLTASKDKSAYWDSLLADRSKAWVTMESMARMFSAQSGLLVSAYHYTTKPDTAMGQAKAGFTKEWKISGYAKDEALDYLNVLNTREGLNTHFKEVFRSTGNVAYHPTEGNRTLVVNVRTQENSSYKPVSEEDFIISDQSHYPFSFEMQITQRFEATDPLAINVAKAPVP